MNQPACQHLEQLEKLGPVGQWAVDRIIALTVENLKLKQQLQQLEARNRQLEQQLEQAQRQAHRQAAPFRRPECKRSPNPGRPGRKAGHEGSFRPRPQQIDQVIEVGLEACPHCGGDLSQKRQLVQYIEEIPPVRPIVTQLITEQGWCARCQKEVYSTHPLQTSRACGAAGVQLGPRALALACDLNKGHGLSMRRTVAILREHFGLQLSAGGLAQLVQRVGRKLQPQYQQMSLLLRQSQLVHADETSWWVGGPGWWLWVFANDKCTVYTVVNSRSGAVVQDLLGQQFGGVLVSDCLVIYDDVNPLQQKCYSHHLKAVSEALAQCADSDYLLAVRALLRTGLILKGLQAEADPEGFARCVHGLKMRAAALLETPRSSAPEEKVRMRLWKQRDHLFTFLERPEVPATNNLAERQLRPAVIARKISCGNKTSKGARAWEVLASVAATCRQNQQSMVAEICRHLPLPPARGP